MESYEKELVKLREELSERVKDLKELKELLFAYKDILKSERSERTHWLGNGGDYTEGSESSCYFTHKPAERKKLDSIEN